MTHRRPRLVPVLALAALALVAGACGRVTNDGAAYPPDRSIAFDDGDLAAVPEGRLRLGYLPNLTHGPALVGVERGLFAQALGPGVQLELVTFSTGTEIIEALFSGAVDASFVGPNPAINGFAQSEGVALRIVAGATSGGASLVVRKGIDGPADLAGAVLATPSLGNTQDVALRAWLADQGYPTDTVGGGQVSVRPQENADTLTSFIDGAIDGAWVPEPWASRLVLEGDGHVLVDERDLWPRGEFVTTHLIVAPPYLADHPANVAALLAGLADSIEAIEADPEGTREAANDGIEAVTGKRLADDVIGRAWNQLTFTLDPVAGSLEGSAERAVAVGLLEPVDLTGIYDLRLLDRILADRGRPAVDG